LTLIGEHFKRIKDWTEIKEKLSAGGIMRLYCLKIYCSLATDTFEHRTWMQENR